jgi:hypothetical protein
MPSQQIEREFFVQKNRRHNSGARFLGCCARRDAPHARRRCRHARAGAHLRAGRRSARHGVVADSEHRARRRGAPCVDCGARRRPGRRDPPPGGRPARRVCGSRPRGCGRSRRCAARCVCGRNCKLPMCARVKQADAVRAVCGASLRNNTEGDLIGYLPFTAALQVGRSDTWEGVSKITRAAADPASPYYVKARPACACCCAAACCGARADAHSCAVSASGSHCVRRAALRGNRVRLRRFGRLSRRWSTCCASRPSRPS